MVMVSDSVSQGKYKESSLTPFQRCHANAMAILVDTERWMAGVDSVHWLGLIGLGALWLGAQIAVVGGLPRLLQRGETPAAPAGTPQAFMLFWIDQYGFIGLTLAIGGAALAAWGLS